MLEKNRKKSPRSRVGTTIMTHKGKIDIWTSLKLKTFDKKEKLQWENIFIKHITNTVLLPTICKEFSKINSKRSEQFN